MSVSPLSAVARSQYSEIYDYNQGSVLFWTDLLSAPAEDPGPAIGHRYSSLRQHQVLPLSKGFLEAHESASDLDAKNSRNEDYSMYSNSCE